MLSMNHLLIAGMVHQYHRTNGILVSIFKGKGEKSVCDNYRGITLLESVGKVLARLLSNRLTEDICLTDTGSTMWI